LQNVPPHSYPQPNLFLSPCGPNPPSVLNHPPVSKYHHKADFSRISVPTSPPNLRFQPFLLLSRPPRHLSPPQKREDYPYAAAPPSPSRVSSQFFLPASSASTTRILFHTRTCGLTINHFAHIPPSSSKYVVALSAPFLSDRTFSSPSCCPPGQHPSRPRKLKLVPSRRRI